METFLRVLSEDEKTQVHERSLKILAETGVKVDTAKGRQYLKDAGAEVDENSKIVKFPRAMVEESLRYWRPLVVLTLTPVSARIFKERSWT